MRKQYIYKLPQKNQQKQKRRIELNKNCEFFARRNVTPFKEKCNIVNEQIIEINQLIYPIGIHMSGRDISLSTNTR